MSPFHTRWKSERGLTMDLLKSLGPSDLEFSPGNQLGPLWKHFRHLGRVQENYLHALETGKITFGVDGASYHGGASAEELFQYLERLDLELREKLKFPSNLKPAIDWFGENISHEDHLRGLIDHEVLHHGMFVVYVRLLNRTFPRSWKTWGL